MVPPLLKSLAIKGKAGLSVPTRIGFPIASRDKLGRKFAARACAIMAVIAGPQFLRKRGSADNFE
jgi:hypothetical protein